MAERFRTRDLLTLVLATALMLIANGRWSVAICAWVAPALLVRYLRTQPPLRAFLGGLAAMSAAAFVWWRGIMPLSGAPYVIASIVFGLVALLPYLADRWLAPRIGGVLGTLVLPSAFVTLEYLAGRVSPFATWGSVAYTQSDNLPLLQLLSVTGLAGVTFLVIWFASIVNSRRGVVLYAALLLAVLLLGGLRLRSAAARDTVSVAAITPRIPTYSVRGDAANDSIHDALKSVRAHRPLTAAQWESFRQRAAAIQQELLDVTEREARNGANLIVWSEGAGIVEARDEPALIAKGAAIAKNTGAWIGLSFLTLDSRHSDTFENKTVLVDPSGKTVWSYRKAHPVPGMEACVPGDGNLPVVTTPFGRIASVICFDMDFPSLLRQAGAAGVDILLCPADDWPEITPKHAEMAVFRAIEQGFSLVRATSNGLSIAVDRFGRVRAAEDYAEGHRVMRAQVPRHGGPTLYSRIGDVVAYACVTLFAGLAVGGGIADRRGTR
jgi:apolipoprotein N-acyltransferase